MEVPETEAKLNIPECIGNVTSHEADPYVSAELLSTGEKYVSTENKTRRKYRGVRQESSGSWHAQIHDPNKRASVYLGTFDTAETAAMAFDEAALKLYGYKARLNFPNREAGSHISYAQSADCYSPSKRKCDSQTLHSRKRYRGVRQDSSGSWNAQILDPNKCATVYLGAFDTAETAAMAFDEAALKLYGCKARLNFPNREDGSPISYTQSADCYSPSKRKRDSQTLHSRKQYIGVRQEVSGGWHAQIHDPNKCASVYLGTFDTAETAAIAFDEAALKLHGCKARLNFPNRKDGSHISYAQSADCYSPSKRKCDSQALHSRKKYRGVRQVSSGSWHAQILDPTKCANVYLGTFDTAETAAMAFDEAALKLYGFKARLNFPNREAGSHISYSQSADCYSTSKRKRDSQTLHARKQYIGVRQEASGGWHAQIHDPNKCASVYLGTFDTAETAAIAFDEAALKLHGCKARLNFPNREAGSHSSYSQSVDRCSVEEDCPSNRKRESQSTPGSVLNLPSHEGGQYHQSSPEQPHREYQNVQNPVTLQEQTKDMQEPRSVSQVIYGSHCGMDEGIVVQPDSSSQPSGEALHHTLCEEYVLSSSWGDLSELDSYLERDKAISSTIAALNEAIQRIFSDRAPCWTEFPHEKATPTDDVEAERNAADLASWSQTSRYQDGR